MAIEVIKRGDDWETEQIWHSSEVSMYMISLVLSGELLFGLSHRHKGELFCLNARTGLTLWLSDGRQGDPRLSMLGRCYFS